MNPQQVTNKDLKLLDEFLTKKSIAYVLTGTAGLYIHGFLPKGYEVHDIDIIVPTATISNEAREAIKEVFLEQETLSDCRYENEHYDHQVYIFRIGKSGTKVNAFEGNILGCNKPINFRQINFEGHIINVHDVNDILEAKLSLNRPKDYQFCVKMFNQICAMFK